MPSVQIFYLNILICIFASNVSSINVPLGETFEALFGYETATGVGTCNRYIDPDIDKAVKVSHQLYSPSLCQYCLMVQRKNIVGIYPIYHHCYTSCEVNQALLTIAAYRDFGDPFDPKIYKANFTFVECPVTTEETMSPISTEKSATDSQSEILLTATFINLSTPNVDSVNPTKPFESTSEVNLATVFGGLKQLLKNLMWIYLFKFFNILNANIIY